MKLIKKVGYFYFPKVDIIDGNILIRKSQTHKSLDIFMNEIHYVFILWADNKNNIGKVEFNKIEQTYFKFVDYQT